MEMKNMVIQKYTGNRHYETSHGLYVVHKAWTTSGTKWYIQAPAGRNFEESRSLTDGNWNVKQRYFDNTTLTEYSLKHIKLHIGSSIKVVE
jgi:hypothetical protein